MSCGTSLLVRFAKQYVSDRSKLRTGLDNFAAQQKTAKQDIRSAVGELRKQRKWAVIVEVYEWYLLTRRFKPDVTTFNVLMDAYGKQGAIAQAEAVFARMAAWLILPDAVSYNVMMSAYSRAGQLENAEKVLERMKEKGYKPGPVTFNVLLELYGKHGRVKKAEEVFREMSHGGDKPSVNAYTLMINVLGGLTRRRKSSTACTALSACPTSRHSQRC
eukprot:TRINITY_DN29720_c0_g1_i1.p1 TRINITY_DN29720_c0_g1~~TRINITY_DN29720_c0_g1_i1.p1  ORF type:complete len:246 (+),score=39.27 TRINITY_DN29720_c0_g1_i1:89-739(+)